MTTSYPTDLTDDQWELLQIFLPPAKTTGRPRNTECFMNLPLIEAVVL
jgi:transposase